MQDFEHKLPQVHRANAVLLTLLRGISETLHQEEWLDANTPGWLGVCLLKRECWLFRRLPFEEYFGHANICCVQ